MTIETFVALKYQLPTETNFIYGQNKKNQELLNTYPEEVVKTWAWRCAEDVEYRAITAEAKEVYRVARLFRAGMATKEELDKAAYTTYAYAAYAAYAAATYPANSASAAFGLPASRVQPVATRKEKWAEYRSWLIDELCKYENSK
jgi:hypothetical protein